MKTQEALVSRQATSLPLKCSSSKELVDILQKAMHDKNPEADNYLSEMHEKSNESPTPNESIREPLIGVISFKIPNALKGAKQTRFKNIVENNPWKKKKKGAQNKGKDLPTNFCLCVKFILNYYYIFQCR